MFSGSKTACVTAAARNVRLRSTRACVKHFIVKCARAVVQVTAWKPSTLTIHYVCKKSEIISGIDEPYLHNQKVQSYN